MSQINRSLLMAALLSFSLPCFADSASISAFLSSISGNWSGSGTQVMHIGKPGSQNITVNQTGSQINAQRWDLTSTITPASGNGSTSMSSYELDASGGLTFITNQYSAPVQVQVSTDSELAVTINHNDPTTNANVRTVRTMTLDSTGALNVVSDVYQNGNLAEHFTYSLRQAQ